MKYAALALVLLLSSTSMAGTRYVNPDAELNGEVSEEALQSTMGQLGAAMGSGKKDVVLRISSPGGSVFAGLIFIQQVQDMKARQGARVHCVADIMAASMAAIILESGVCDTRATTDRTVILFHGVSGGARGKTGDVADALNLMRIIDLAGAAIVAPRLGMTPEQYLARIDRRDWFLSADEALAAGAVEEVLRVGVTANVTKPRTIAKSPEVSEQPAPTPVTPAPAPAPSRLERARAWVAAHLFQVKVAGGVFAASLLGWLTAWLVSPLPVPVPVKATRRRRR